MEMISAVKMRKAVSAVMNVRLALSTRNLSIVRASAPVVAGEIYHVMVTYEQDATVKLYVNGVLDHAALEWRAAEARSQRPTR